MRFVFEGQGDCRTVNGYFFWNKKAISVTDHATIERLKKDHDFRRVEDEMDQAPQRQEAAKAEILNRDLCPKCGRVVRQGKVLHIKHCKGQK